MKNICYVRAALPFLCAAVVLTGCKSPETQTHYIRVSDAACAFKGTGNLPVTVEVYSNPAAWDAEVSASWVTISDRKETSFTVEVADNESVEERSAQVIVNAGQARQVIDIVQEGADHTFPRYRMNPEVFQNGAPMSPNGKYVGSFYSGYDDADNPAFFPVIIDVETDEWYELGPFPKTLFELSETGCISDAGELIIATANDENVIFYMDGNYEKIVAPAGYTSAPQISRMAADGTMVGWASKNGVSNPLKWVNGEAIELPKPALNYRDEPIGDVQARGISADGRIIYGTTWDNRDFGLVYWDENNEVHYVGEDVRYCRAVDRPDGYEGTYKYNLCDGMWTSATKTNISPNGKYIAGTYRVESLVEGNESEVTEVNYPAFYNTETGKTVIFEELVGGGGAGATSDGLGFTVDNPTLGASSGMVVDIENGVVLGNALDWIREEYGIIINSGYLMYMPDSKDRFQGAMLYTGGAAIQGIEWYVGPER